MLGGDRSAHALGNGPENGASTPIVVFVGSALSFSEQIVRIANVEFDGVAFERCDSVEDLRSSDVINFENILVLILDEALAEELPDLLSASDQAEDRCQIVLGYRDINAANSVLKSLDAQGNRCAVSYLPMNQQFDIWLSIMRLLLCGGKYIPEELLVGMGQVDGNGAQPSGPADSNLSELTDREREVLALVSEGKPNKTIATEMDLSEHTIKLHIHHVITKLGVRNRTEAAIFFLGGGGTDGDPAPCV